MCFPWGNARRLAATKMSKRFCAATASESTWLLLAAGQNRTQGTLSSNGMHFVMCSIENKTEPAVTTKPSNDGLPC